MFSQLLININVFSIIDQYQYLINVLSIRCWSGVWSWSTPTSSQFVININVWSIIYQYPCWLKLHHNLLKFSSMSQQYNFVVEGRRSLIYWYVIEKKLSNWVKIDIWLKKNWSSIEKKLILRNTWAAIERSLIKHWFYSMFSLCPTSKLAPNIYRVGLCGHGFRCRKKDDAVQTH